MAKTDINENIYRAIDTIIDARLQNVNFNSTVLCTIVDDSKAASGIFTVDNAGIKFQATSMDKSFKVNDQVYVTVPNNNFDAQKIIIGKKEDLAELQEQWKDPFSYLDIKYRFDDDDDKAIVITPTKNGVASEKFIKRIVLNGDFFNDLNDEDNQYTTSLSAETDLYNSGWIYYSETIDPSLTIDWSQQPFKAILYRSDKAIYRIKTLDIQEDIYATVPVGGGQPEYAQTGVIGQYRFTNKGWRDNDYDGTSPAPPYVSPNYWISFDQPFYVFYNEKQYSPISFAGLKNIIITADFKSDIGEKITTITSGSYYLECKLFLTDMNKNINESNAAIEVSLIMASNQDFLGDPYNYFDYFTQTVLFDTSNYQHCVLNKIEFILHQNGDFDGEGDFSNSKIYIKNPKIYFGLPKQETEIGYANYESIFRTNSKYYQKLTPNGVWEINHNLKAVPPINTELDADGPFDFYIDAHYQLTEDTTPDPNKVYYQLYQGNYVQYEHAPDNPKAVKAYEYIESYYVKRYLPKLYYKDGQGNYNTSSIIKVQYYDDLLYFAAPNSIITTHDWHDNKYKWDQEEAQWVLRERGTLSEVEYPDTLIPYICYLPGKQIASYFGAIEKNNTTPQVGISSSEQNIDVTLASSASNANVVLEAYNNRNITLQGNEDIIINNNNKSQIKISEDLLLIKNINNGNGNGIKLSNNPPDILTNKGEVTVRLGYTNGQPAINISIQNNTGSDRRNLTIIANSANGFIMNTDNDDLPILFKLNNKNIGKLRCFINNNSQPQINFAMYNSAGNASSVAFTKDSIETLASLIN